MAPPPPPKPHKVPDPSSPRSQTPHGPGPVLGHHGEHLRRLRESPRAATIPSRPLSDRIADSATDRGKVRKAFLVDKRASPARAAAAEVPQQRGECANTSDSAGVLPDPVVHEVSPDSASPGSPTDRPLPYRRPDPPPTIDIPLGSPRGSALQHTASPRDATHQHTSLGLPPTSPRGTRAAGAGLEESDDVASAAAPPPAPFARASPRRSPSVKRNRSDHVRAWTVVTDMRRRKVPKGVPRLANPGTLCSFTSAYSALGLFLEPLSEDEVIMSSCNEGVSFGVTRRLIKAVGADPHGLQPVANFVHLVRHFGLAAALARECGCGGVSFAPVVRLEPVVGSGRVDCSHVGLARSDPCAACNTEPRLTVRKGDHSLLVLHARHGFFAVPPSLCIDGRVATVVAAVAHKGPDSASGHYITYRFVRDPDGKLAFILECDDATVSLVQDDIAHDMVRLLVVVLNREQPATESDAGLTATATPEGGYVRPAASE